MFDLDSADRLLRTIERIFYSPIALAFGLLIGMVGMSIGFIIIWKIVRAHNETLSRGNNALERVAENTSVSSARQAEGVEAMRSVVDQIRRMDGDLSTHDRNEEGRHRETLREVRERPPR